MKLNCDGYIMNYLYTKNSTLKCLDYKIMGNNHSIMFNATDNGQVVFTESDVYITDSELLFDELSKFFIPYLINGTPSVSFMFKNTTTFNISSCNGKIEIKHFYSGNDINRVIDELNKRFKYLFLA